MRKPSYYRARIAVINLFIGQINEAIAYLEAGNSEDKEEKLKESEFNRALLRNGFVYPGNLKYPSWEQLEKGIIQELRNSKYTEDPLTFQELTTYNTWFVIHPEKIAGEEKATSSREFPVTTSGTKELVVETLKGRKLPGQQTAHEPESNDFELEIELLALELELQLLNFGLSGIFTKPIRNIVLR